MNIEDLYPLAEFDYGNWRYNALCRTEDTSIFFREDRGGGEFYLKARCTCFKCPVQKKCLDFALDNSIYHGMWGGLSYRERLAYLNGDRSHEVTVLDVLRSTRRNQSSADVAKLLGISEEEVRVSLRKRGNDVQQNKENAR